MLHSQDFHYLNKEGVEDIADRTVRHNQLLISECTLSAQSPLF